MRAFTVLAFDEIIATAATSYYTSASLNAQLGSADGLVLHAITTMVSGSPTLTCQIEHSGNGDDWVNAQGSPEISAFSASNFGATHGQLFMFNPVLLTYVRVRVTMPSGTQMRVKLYVTGHISQAAGAPTSAGQTRPMLSTAG